MFAVLADVHANLHALEAVVEDVHRQGVTSIWHLGDAVGYGGDPFACVQFLADLDALLIAGNHELAASDPGEAMGFNPVAAQAISWTREALSPQSAHSLAMLPLSHQPQPEVLLFHGLPGNPNGYIRTAADAAFAFQSLARRDPRLRIGFFGHTHRPMVFTSLGDLPIASFEPGEELLLAPARRYLVNPGSVGQPRDGDPRAHYLLYDPEERIIRFRRVAYDVRAAQARILECGLPAALAARLSQGL